MSRGYRQLQVCRKAIDFVDAVYDTTDNFPRHELFGLTNQLRRAAVSVTSNIAEGQARHSRRDFIRFLRQSKGSLAELETQIIIAVRRNYMSRETGRKLLSQATEIDRMLSGLISSLAGKLEETTEEQLGT